MMSATVAKSHVKVGTTFTQRHRPAAFDELQTNGARMIPPPTYLTPGLGGKTLTIAAIWLAFSLLFSWSLGNPGVYPLSLPALTRLGFQLGVTFGFGAALCWWATAARSPVTRVILRVLLVAMFGYLLSLQGTPDWLRHTVNLAGLMIVQSICFAWFGVPGWMIPGGDADLSRPAAGQFQIADLLAMTTALAVLLGLIAHYVAPVESSVYWTVMLMVWGVAPVIATCFALASLTPSPSRARWQLTIGISLTLALSILLSIAQDIVGGVANDRFAIPYFYTLLFGLYGFTVYLLGRAGRQPDKCL